MSTHQSSFTIKSSHKFVNPSTEDSTNPDTNYYYSYNSTTSSQKQPKGWTNTDTVRKEGSANGMAIRTTNTSIEDFY